MLDWLMCLNWATSARACRLWLSCVPDINPPCCGTLWRFRISAVSPPAASCTVPQMRHHPCLPQSCPAAWQGIEGLGRRAGPSRGTLEHWTAGCMYPCRHCSTCKPHCCAVAGQRNGSCPGWITEGRCCAHNPVLVLVNSVLQVSSLYLQSRQVLHKLSSTFDVLLELCIHVKDATGFVLYKDSRALPAAAGLFGNCCWHSCCTCLCPALPAAVSNHQLCLLWHWMLAET